MVRHFETKSAAKDYLKSKPFSESLSIYKKLKGHKNRAKKPFVVCTYIEWLNLY